MRQEIAVKAIAKLHPKDTRKADLRHNGKKARKNSGASTGWAQSNQNFSWTRLGIRPFGTLSAKQSISSLLFMLKSNKNPGPLLNGSRTPTGGPRGTKFPLDIPSPGAHSGSIKCLSGMACCCILRAGWFNFFKKPQFCCIKCLQTYAKISFFRQIC